MTKRGGECRVLVAERVPTVAIPSEPAGVTDPHVRPFLDFRQYWFSGRFLEMFHKAGSEAAGALQAVCKRGKQGVNCLRDTN